MSFDNKKWRLSFSTFQLVQLCWGIIVIVYFCRFSWEIFVRYIMQNSGKEWKLFGGWLTEKQRKLVAETEPKDGRKWRRHRLSFSALGKQYRPVMTVGTTRWKKARTQACFCLRIIRSEADRIGCLWKVKMRMKIWKICYKPDRINGNMLLEEEKNSKRRGQKVDDFFLRNQLVRVVTFENLSELGGKFVVRLERNDEIFFG